MVNWITISTKTQKVSVFPSEPPPYTEGTPTTTVQWTDSTLLVTDPPVFRIRVSDVFGTSFDKRYFLFTVCYFYRY